jgi:predicted transcriptional regulator
MTDESTSKSSEIRSRLMERISSRPGISHQELLKLLKQKEASLRYHLHYLEKQNRIHSKLLRGHRCYYPGMKRAQRENEENILRHLSLTQQRILTIVEEMSDLTQKELVRALRMNRFIVSYNIGKLKELGLVRIRREGRVVRYQRAYPDDIKKEILRVLASDLLRGQIDEGTYRRLREKLIEE